MQEYLFLGPVLSILTYAQKARKFPIGARFSKQAINTSSSPAGSATTLAHPTASTSLERQQSHQWLLPGKQLLLRCHRVPAATSCQLKRQSAGRPLRNIIHNGARFAVTTSAGNPTLRTYCTLNTRIPYLSAHRESPPIFILMRL